MPEDKIQICTSCGAEQSYTQADAKLRCEFCKNEIIIIKEGEDLPSAINVKFIVPLSINDKELTNLTHKYMSEGKHTPDDLIEKSRITEQKLFYVPTHLFRGSYIAQWTAMFGFDRLEPYTAYETQSYQTNNGQWHQRRVAVTKYRVVTDWHPASGLIREALQYRSIRVHHWISELLGWLRTYLLYLNRLNLNQSF